MQFHHCETYSELFDIVVISYVNEKKILFSLLNVLIFSGPACTLLSFLIRMLALLHEIVQSEAPTNIVGIFAHWFTGHCVSIVSPT